MSTGVPKWDGKQDVIEWAMSLPDPTVDETDKTVEDVLADQSTAAVHKTESPLEARMFNALAGCFNTIDGWPQRLGNLFTQYPVTVDGVRYRLDYAVVRTLDKHTVLVAIELDGHEFHHATKEQVERDNFRTRALAKAGWIVLRYAGSEVWRDPGACAFDVAGVVIEAVDRLTGCGS